VTRDRRHRQGDEPYGADEDAAVVPSGKHGDQLTTVIAVIGRKATDMMGTCRIT
jgi:hypothetical protein